MPTTVEDFLAHHGVKGMKWGRRKHAAADEAIKTGVADKKMFSRREEGQSFIQNNFMDEVYRPIKRK